MLTYFPLLVNQLAACDLEAFANDLLSHNLIDEEVYECLELQTMTKSQKTSNVIMNVSIKVSENPIKEFPKFLGILRKQNGMEHLVVVMETTYSKLCVLDSTCSKVISFLDFYRH